MQDTQSLVEELRRQGIPEAESLGTLAAPQYRLIATRSSLSNVPIGGTRFGGSPDVPNDFAWPYHRERPLTFLAQFDLSIIRTKELPDCGWLLFFYDVAEQPMGYDPIHKGGARVVHFDCPREELSRSEHPDVTSAGGPFEPCSLQLRYAVALPDVNDRSLAEYIANGCESDTSRYRAHVHTLCDVTAAEPNHHLLGHPRLIQGDVRDQCQLVTNGIYCGDPSGYKHPKADSLLKDASNDWQLLLELDSDEAGPDWIWGNEGRIDYFIRRSDLLARAFDRSWLVLQCRNE